MSFPSQQFSCYKGISGRFGAAQFTLAVPYNFCSQCKERDYIGSMREHCNQKTEVRDGAVFLNICSPAGPNQYDWENKVVFALSIVDIGKLLYGLRSGCVDGDGNPSEVKLMHDPGAKTETMGKVQKHLNLTSPKGARVGFMLNVAQINGNERKSHTVPLTSDEATVLATLLAAAIPRILAW